eukprot:2647861-Rhodomonas_salina.1
MGLYDRVWCYAQCGTETGYGATACWTAVEYGVSITCVLVLGATKGPTLTSYAHRTHMLYRLTPSPILGYHVLLHSLPYLLTLSSYAHCHTHLTQRTVLGVVT